MKKLYTLLLTIAMFFVFTGVGNAQVKNAVKINIFSPIVKTFSGFYERALGDAVSIQAGFFYTGTKVEDTKFSGWGVTPEFRLYPGKSEDLKGFYLAPFGRYSSFSLSGKSTDPATLEEIDGKATLSTFGGGLLIGGQFLFGDIVTLDIFIGPKYGVSDIKVDAGEEDDFSLGSFDGFGVRGGVTIGIAF
jgi:hypothetical protein